MKLEDFGLSCKLEFFNPKAAVRGTPRVTYTIVYECDKFSVRLATSCSLSFSRFFVVELAHWTVCVPYREYSIAGQSVGMLIAWLHGFFGRISSKIYSMICIAHDVETDTFNHSSSSREFWLVDPYIILYLAWPYGLFR